ncbi:glycosyltransferase family 1 protein [Microlunatus lacustris]
MRVALVSEHASPLAAVGAVDAGGQNVHVDALAAALAGQGHDVTVHTRRDDPSQPEQVVTDAGYRVRHVPAGPAAPLPKDDLWPHMPAFADALTEQLTASAPDLVHGHFWMSAWAADRAADALDLPRLVTFHALGTVKRRHQGLADTSPPERVAVELAVARTADRVIATCSDEVRELRRMGLPAGRTTVVPCGVDATHFTPADDGTPVPARTRRHRLVTVGRPVPRKGFAVVVEALAGLPDTELLVVGGTGDPGADPELDRLRELAARVGVTDRLHCLGQVPRPTMPALLRSADAVVCAPWYEPFGLVPLEAMACGVPVVAAAVGGMLDSVADGVTGLLVPPQDPAALRSALATLLAAPERRAQWGAAGRQRVLERYTWPRVAAATTDVYAAVLDRRSQPASQPARRR